MSYRTKRPRTRTILSFGVGATLAIMQLGAGCVPVDPSRRCSTGDGGGAVDDAGECVTESTPRADGGEDGGSDAK